MTRAMHQVEQAHSQPSSQLLLADDHTVVAEALAGLLTKTFGAPDLAFSGMELGEALQRKSYAAVIVDISLGDMTGFEALTVARQRGDRTPFIFLTMHDDPALAKSAFRMGASAFLTKDQPGDELILAIKEVLKGRSYVSSSIGAQIVANEVQASYALTKRQRAVAREIARGSKSSEIAEKLGVSLRTVHTHRLAIMRQLGVKSIVALVHKAEQLGLVLSGKAGETDE